MKLENLIWVEIGDYLSEKPILLKIHPGVRVFLPVPQRKKEGEKLVRRMKKNAPGGLKVLLRENEDLRISLI